MSHPAQYSASVLDAAFEILNSRWPDWFGRPLIFDPFSGVGTRLAAACAAHGWDYSGVELEEAFIQAPHVHQGDATRWESYPPARFPVEYGSGRWCILTSPAYSNGMSDHHLARDGSPRKNYRKAKAEITGDAEVELLLNNMGRYGYRGSKRPEEGGKSAKRAEYWRIAQESVRWWGTAELVLVNVSDFVYTRNGEERVEPLVADWKELLSLYGWTAQIDHLVPTPRMRHGENAEKRVAHEVIIEAWKP